MRFRSLVLERYGAFTGQALRFQPGARLHVVHGANEAGKTSALTAIGDFLFGFGHTTSYGFAHDLASLRIGATLAFQDGTTRTLRRRKGKGKGNTLLDEADRPLAEDVLTPRLAGLTRGMFDGEYGLTAAALRAGGVELMKAGGRLAETLAASSATLSALVALRGVLDGEADGLFRPTRAGAKDFYVACDRHKLADQRLRDAVVTVDAWRQANEQAAAAAEEVVRLKQEEARLRAELASLERARRARPKLAAIAAARAEAAAYADLDAVDARTLARWRHASDETARLDDEALALAATDETDRARIAALAIDDAVLAAGGAIDRLRERIGEIKKAQSDLPRRVGAMRMAWDELAQSAARVGLPSPEALLAGQPTDAQLAHVRALLLEGQRAVDRLHEAEAALARATADRDALSQAADTGDRLANPAGLKRRFDAFRDVTVEAAEVRREAAAIELKRRKLAEATAALHPPVACLDALASRPLPTSAEIERAAAVANKLETDLRDADEAVAAAAEQTRKIERDIARLSARGGTPATLADLNARRRVRDAALADLRRSLDAPLPERHEAFATAADAARAIDEVTDRILADVERASRYAKAQEDLAEARARQCSAGDRRSRVLDLSKAARDAWTALWAPSAIEPAPPDQMRGWRERIGQALEARDQLDERQSKVEALKQKLDGMREGLQALAAEAGASHSSGLAVELLHRETATAIDALQTAWNDRSHRAVAVAKSIEAVEQATALCAQRRKEDLRWHRAWPGAVGAIGLAADAGFAEAEAALAVWQRVPGERRAFEREQQSARSIERDLETFEVEVGALTARLAPDLAGRPAAEALSQLGQRLARASKEHEERRLLEEAGAERQNRRTAGQAKRARLTPVIAEARQHLGLADAAPLAPMLVRLAEKQTAEARHADLLADLASIADGADEATLRAEQADLDFTALDESIRTLQERLEAVSDAQNLAAHARERAKADVEALAQGRDAGEAARAKEEAAAEILDVAERWLVRVAAAKLATLAIEQHRASVQDPLMARASQLFATVTGGGFRGLTTKFDDRDALILAAERGNGTVVDIDGLSEGTRDQLFLVLRLALLERQAHAPLPFIGDDLLASFDEERTAHALEMLADFGAGRQVILFTHHAHVADIARRQLGGRADIIGLPEAIWSNAAAA